MKAVDLFAGCGGMSLGFQQANVEIAAAFDNWSPAVQIYRENFSHPIHDVDLSEPSTTPLIQQYKPDMIIGGPPCQDFSLAGKQKMGERANLTLRFAEIIQEVVPKWVVFENVYNIARFPILDRLKSTISSAGYGISSRVLDASYCGVPQKRKRFFLIGKLGEADGFLDYALEEGLSDSPMTVRDYLGDKLGTEFYYMHPRSYARRGVFSIDEPAVTIRGINRPIPPNYLKHSADAAPVSEGVRALTTRERGYLQTFPDSFSLPGSKTGVELAIGNAVPPALAYYVARRIELYDSMK